MHNTQLYNTRVPVITVDIHRISEPGTCTITSTITAFFLSIGYKFSRPSSCPEIRFRSIDTQGMAMPDHYFDIDTQQMPMPGHSPDDVGIVEDSQPDSSPTDFWAYGSTWNLLPPQTSLKDPKNPSKEMPSAAEFLAEIDVLRTRNAQLHNELVEAEEANLDLRNKLSTLNKTRDDNDLSEMVPTSRSAQGDRPKKRKQPSGDANHDAIVIEASSAGSEDEAETMTMTSSTVTCSPISSPKKRINLSSPISSPISPTKRIDLQLLWFFSISLHLQLLSPTSAYHLGLEHGARESEKRERSLCQNPAPPPPPP